MYVTQIVKSKPDNVSDLEQSENTESVIVTPDSQRFNLHALKVERNKLYINPPSLNYNDRVWICWDCCHVEVFSQVCSDMIDDWRFMGLDRSLLDRCISFLSYQPVKTLPIWVKVSVTGNNFPRT